MIRQLTGNRSVAKAAMAQKTDDLPDVSCLNGKNMLGTGTALFQTR